MAAVREKIRMNSTGTKKDGKKTGYFKTTTKNKRKTTDKLEFKKYCRFCGKHIIHKETKIK